MRYIISESKLHGFIRDYLTSNIHPDYHTFYKDSDMQDIYRRDVEKYGWYDFTIDDRAAYSYKKNGVLYIREWLVVRLNDLFGQLWQPIFKKWFEEYTGLQVEGVVFGADIS